MITAAKYVRPGDFIMLGSDRPPSRPDKQTWYAPITRVTSVSKPIDFYDYKPGKMFKWWMVTIVCVTDQYGSENNQPWMHTGPDGETTQQEAMRSNGDQYELDELLHIVGLKPDELKERQVFWELQYADKGW